MTTTDLPPDAPADLPRDVEEDPRIRDRRIEVQREAGRKRLRIMLIIGCVFIAGGLAYLAVDSPALDVDHVRVEGTVHVDPDAVREAAQIEIGEPLLRVSGGAAAKRVEALPWVANARVVRKFPGTVRIEVSEYDAVAFARRANGTAAVLAADGRVVADVDIPPPGVIEVLGMRRPPGVGGIVSPPDAAGVVTRIPDALARRVVAIDLAGDDIALDLDSGGEVRLGTLDDLDAKASAAIAVLTELNGDPFGYIDVRVPEAPAVK